MTSNDSSAQAVSLPQGDHHILQAYTVNAAVSERQCMGSGFERRNDYRQGSRQVLEGKLTLPPHGLWDAGQFTDWSADPFSSRNWQFQFHALRWLSPVRYDAIDGSEQARLFWLSTVQSWIEHNPPYAPASDFAWMDMADGLRAQEIVFGWSLARSDDERAMLLHALEIHGQWLSDHKNQSKANHALHQNMGLFVLSSFLGHADWQRLSVERLHALFEHSFDENGANDEGSIDYHRMNIDWWQTTWRRIDLEGLSIPVDVSHKLRQAATFLAHAVRPNGTMVPIGDTHVREVSDMGFAELEFAASKGAHGTPPASSFVTASNGYVLGRSGWGTDTESFAAQGHYSLRFGSAAGSHDHEDRGALTYFSEGVDWLTDPGSYAYEPDDPFRQYLRSRIGHNMLVVDDRRYKRLGQVYLDRADFTDAYHDVLIRDDNYEGLTLSRRFLYLPTLDAGIVIDDFESTTDVTVRQLWHTDQHIKPRYRDSSLELQHADGARLVMKWLNPGLRPKVSYAKDNTPEYWVSRRWGQKQPAAGFQVEQTGRRGRFATIFAPSTTDHWAVVSSFTKQDSLWIRLIRGGVLWILVINDDGVTIEQDMSNASGQDHTSLVADTTVALLKLQVDALEKRLNTLATLNAQHIQPSNTPPQDQAFVDDLTNTKKTLKKLQIAQEKERELAKKQTAALLPLIPASVPRNTLLVGEKFQDYVPYIQDPLYLYDQWQHKSDAAALTLTQRRRLAKDLHSRGYLARSLEVLTSIFNHTGNERDAQIIKIRGSELELLRGNVEPTCQQPQEFHPVTGRILHVVGKAIPETQSGYTLRTHYLAQAQVAKGYDIHVFRQVGGVAEPVAGTRVTQEGVVYHLPDGPVRNSLPWDQWLQINTDSLAEHVREIRPSVLHCHADFYNHMIAAPVAQAFGIPLIYESRGFWEESFLSRVETKAGRDLSLDYERYGLPDVYTLRREREDQARAQADRVTTLAEVMKDHIIERGEIAERISVTPNGVDPEDFPIVEPDLELKDQLGIPRDAPVIGYITSVVEYEGIDTLISAFALLRKEHPDAWMVLVGDGPVLNSLKLQAKNLGLTDRVIFTGRLPHEQVLTYYSLIDIFVVPRKDRAVCRLVTPLKPFEAFSTGRTVVVSDVDALQEIASQSQAAATFTASDSVDLARVIGELLADPDRRREMAAAGAAWVRAARSWKAIADLYDRPYEQLGIRAFSPVEQTEHPTTDLVGIRSEWAHLSRDEAVKYLSVHGEESRVHPVPIADGIMTNGWGGHGFPPVALPEDFAWSEIVEGDRTWQMHMHSWEFMGPVLDAWKVTGEDKYLLWCVQRALRWGSTFTTIDTDSMAWYDMALAYRSVALQALIRAAAGSEQVPDSAFEQLMILALRQRDAHWMDYSFNPRSNHGYYAAVSQVVLARGLGALPGMQALRYQADSRLRLMTASQFLPDGGHAEHSPDYHRMLLTSFEGAIRVGAIDDPEVLALIAKAAEVLGWMIVPNGRILQMGDSPERKMNDGRSSYSPTTQWVLSNGAKGQEPKSSSLMLPKTGYAFMRNIHSGDSSGSRGSYLALTAGFHSRTHKQCDDQSLVWFESGQEILVDGGRYGYGALLAPDSPLRVDGFYYSDPIRQYMESCAAHSTISVDSQLHNRRRTPYGSGIKSLDELEDGGYRVVSVVPHTGWSSERTVTYYPGRQLIIEDHIKAEDNKPHTVHTWFLLDGGLTVSNGHEHGEQITSGQLRIASERWKVPLHLIRTSDAAELLEVRINRTAENLTKVRGLRSRIDRTLEPAWSLHWEREFTGQVRARTEFVFGSAEQDSESVEAQGGIS